MESLDSLTNDQLRVQLVEHGLANVPVTNTTRKVLIKRLQAVIDGGGVDKTNKSRRETIHVAKFSSDGDESESDKKPKEPVKTKTTASSRRATINVTAASSIPVKTNIPVSVPSVETMPKPVSTRRSSGRITPVAAIASDPPAPKPVSKAPQIVDVPEEPEDNSPFIPVSQKRLPRSSRSPSMGKSAMVTTSFNQVVVKSKPIIEETVELSDEEAEEDDVDVDDIEDNEPETSGELEIGNYTTSYLSGLNDPRTSTAASSKYESKTSNRSSINTSYASSSAYRPPSRADEYKSSATQRRYTTSNWNSTLPLDDRQRTPEKNVVVTDVHTPYLSDFTRRLSKLRAEPLSEASALRRDSGDNAIDGTELSSHYYRTSSQVHGRLQRNQTDDSVWAHIKTLIISIERKYRYILWTIVLVLVVIFLTTVFIA